MCLCIFVCLCMFVCLCVTGIFYVGLGRFMSICVLVGSSDQRLYVFLYIVCVCVRVG